MNIREIQHLQSERSALEEMLAELPETSVIERMGLESRRKEIEEELASQPVPDYLPAQVRLSKDNIHEEDQEIIGAFQGVLPKGRTFEFVVDESEEVISGKVGLEIEDANEINSVLHRKMIIKLHTKRIGQGKPRYTLVQYAEAIDQ